MISRRALNRAALALALSPWAQAMAQPHSVAPRWARDPFALGVASGMPRPDSVVLWTRLCEGLDSELPVAAGQSALVRYEICSDEAMRQPVQQGEVHTDACRAFAVHVLAQGLQPGHDYWYRFHCGNASSRIGHTRTAPAADAAVASLRLALASCQHYEQGFFSAHREIAQQPLDLVLFVGDYIYETVSKAAGLRQHAGPVPYTLAQYRQRHAQYKLDADLQAAHAAHPWLLMWDDHEVVNDYAGELDPFYTAPARFLQRRAAAYQAYFEHMPVRLPRDADRAGLWARAPLHNRYLWGRLAELWTLDCRQFRSAQACDDPQRRSARMVSGCDELADPTRSMLGTAQERWLAEGLAQSKRRWQLLAQTTQIAASGINAATPGGPRSTFTGAWDGYPEARRRLLQSVADAGLTSVVALGGDVHHHLAANLRLQANDEASPVLASEFVTSAITSRGLGEKSLATMRASNPDIALARGDGRGYVLLEVTPEATQATFRGTTYPVAADAVFTTQAVGRVANGRPGVEIT